MKYYKLLLVIVVAFILQGCNIKIEEKTSKGEKYTSYIEISYEEYNDKISNKEDFILYLGSSYCSHCANFKPVLESIIKNYNLEVYYLDMSKLIDNEYAIVQNKTKLQGTPTIVFIENGVVKTSPKIVGEASYDTALSKFKESGYIK